MKKKSRFFGSNKQVQAKEEFDENMKAILSEASDIKDHLEQMGVDPASVRAVCVTTDRDTGEQAAYTVNLNNLSTKPRQLSDAELDLLSGQADIDGEEIDFACKSCPRNQQTLNESSVHGRVFPLTVGEVALLRNIKS